MMRRIFLLIALPLLIILFARCDDIKDISGIDDTKKIVPPRFHTESNEGLWQDKSVTHTPLVTFINKRTIEVTVPLVPSKKPKHYIEAIILLDAKGKEVAVVHFPFSYNKAMARFTLPDPDKGRYRIVAKCNIHDMWSAPVGREKEQ